MYRIEIKLMFTVNWTIERKLLKTWPEFTKFDVVLIH